MLRPSVESILRTLAFSLFSVAIVFAAGCNQRTATQKTGAGFVKLNTSLEDALAKVTLIVPEMSGDESGTPIEVVVGAAFTGEGMYDIGGGETHGFRYTLLSQYAVEGNRYLFVPVGYNWGGSGTFFFLTAVDKATLKSVSEADLGDRVRVQKAALASPRSDSVAITYLARGDYGVYDPSKAVEIRFKMVDSRLQEVSP